MASLPYLVNEVLYLIVMEKAVLIVIALSLAFAVGCWGSTRKIGFGLAFVLSLLNLFIGIIAVACSKKLENKEKEGE